MSINKEQLSYITRAQRQVKDTERLTDLFRRERNVLIVAAVKRGATYKEVAFAINTSPSLIAAIVLEANRKVADNVRD